MDEKIYPQPWRVYHGKEGGMEVFEKWFKKEVEIDYYSACEAGVMVSPHLVKEAWQAGVAHYAQSDLAPFEKWFKSQEERELTPFEWMKEAFQAGVAHYAQNDLAGDERKRIENEFESEHDYDAGILNDYGGGDVGWWQDYIRFEINSCNEYWKSIFNAIIEKGE